MNKKEVIAMKEPKVLIVDDEASIRRQLLVSLTQRGFEVEGCEDGLSALKKIESARRNGIPYKYIILDIRLPDIDGMKLLQVIKSKYPDLGVVVISGYGDEHTSENVERYSGNAYMDKPFQIEELEAELRRLSAEEKEVLKKAQVGADAERLVSAYVLIRGNGDAELERIYAELYFGEGVLYCDAVRGDWDIVVLLQAQDRKGIEELVDKKIRSLNGIEEVEVHYSERPWLGEDLESFIQNYERIRAMESGEEVGMDKRNRRSVSAYAVLEIDRSHLNALFTKFYFTDNVVYCDATDHGNMLILLIQGATFDQIKKTIANEVRPQPGVLRVKELNIIELLAM